PWLIFLLVFVAGAIVLALYFSFTDYDLLSDPVFVGLKNYQKAFQDESFLHAIRNVATYTAVVVPSQTFIGLVMAAILDRKLPFRRFFRIAWYLPCVASSVVTTLIFMWLFLPDGFINAALNFVGLPVRLKWLRDQVKIATNGGPNEATLTVTYLIWKQGFRDLNMGYASALGVILFAGIFIISLIQRRVLDVRPDY